MIPAVESLKAKELALADDLNALLRDNAFENRYAMHPRRLAALGSELASFFLRCMADPTTADAFALGQDLARTGLGERTIILLSVQLQHFCRTELRRNSKALEEITERLDSTVIALLCGFMKFRETQILTDQEQLRRALATALESQSQELLVKNHAINTSINGIILADLDGKVTWVNASFLQMWGFASANEALGLEIGGLWVGEDARKVVRLLPRTGGWRGELTAQRKDGSAFSIEVSASLVKNEEGGAIGMMSSVIDITERKRLQAQIIQAQKMEALGQLAGGITHDFNNLLTAISGYMQLLLLNAPRDTQMHEDLLQIKAAVDRGSGLTQQLRFFTRQATGTRQIISLNEVAKETYGIFHRTFPMEISVELALAPSLWTIEADPNQMSQVLVNLCVNARDAMTQADGRAAGGTLRIETANVTLSEEQASRYVNTWPGRYIMLKVSDTGTGMPPELLEKLFIPFITTKGPKSGTGLGLAVVYGIVSNHRGFIDVHSTVGRGSTFEVFLPVTERETVLTEQPPATASLARGSGKILVVDDETQVREVMCRALSSCGYTALSAANGRDALALCLQHTDFDLVILDMVMPDMGGRECLARLREGNPELKVIIVTGFTADGSALELLKEGARDILEKPLDLTLLTEKVQKLLGGSQSC
jgi:two-component system cell cycle sensor histidine kinase/response regulator CckA